MIRIDPKIAAQFAAIAPPTDADAPAASVAPPSDEALQRSRYGGISAKQAELVAFPAIELEGGTTLCPCCLGYARISGCMIEVYRGEGIVIIHIYSECEHCGERTRIIAEEDYGGRGREKCPTCRAAGKRAQCESPIESTLWDALTAAHASYEEQLQPQYELLGYRADFAWPESKIVIEADGHEYHERTKEQAARDRKRDRVMQRAGWMVLRFTGSEIHADAAACAREVWAAHEDRISAK